MATGRQFDRAPEPDREKIPATNAEMPSTCQFARSATLICATEAKNSSQTYGWRNFHWPWFSWRWRKSYEFLLLYFNLGFNLNRCFNPRFILIQQFFNRTFKFTRIFVNFKTFSLYWTEIKKRNKMPGFI